MSSCTSSDQSDPRHGGSSHTISPQRVPAPLNRPCSPAFPPTSVKAQSTQRSEIQPSFSFLLLRPLVTAHVCLGSLDYSSRPSTGQVTMMGNDHFLA